MKKHFNFIISLFYSKPTKSTLLDGLKMRTVTTPYAAALICGHHSRNAGVKLWTVAVKTIEPEVVFANHAAWMLNIQCERALIAEEIGLLEKNDILTDARKYKNSVVGYRVIRNNKL